MKRSGPGGTRSSGAGGAVVAALMSTLAYAELIAINPAAVSFPSWGTISRNRDVLAQAEALGVGVVATNDVRYATPLQRIVHDVLTCAREKATVQPDPG